MRNLVAVIFVAISAMWIGAFGLSLLGYEHWTSLPIFMTAVLLTSLWLYSATALREAFKAIEDEND